MRADLCARAVTLILASCSSLFAYANTALALALSSPFFLPLPDDGIRIAGKREKGETIAPISTIGTTVRR